jgi:hypothetical protein
LQVREQVRQGLDPSPAVARSDWLDGGFLEVCVEHGGPLLSSGGEQ